nr:class I SAM-dependent methyltransferase [uncultured Anaerocolumna sp.]
MNFNWNLDTIRWYQEANNYTGYFKNLASFIVPKLKGYSTLCDIGCGLGLIDIELCKYIENITCIDINEEAIKTLENSIKDKNISNISPRLINCDDMKENWDVIFLSFFGSRNLKNFLPYCKKLIAVVGSKNQTGLFPEKYRSFHKNTFHNVEEILKKEGITYGLTEVSFEFGQPLHSIEDAKNFVRTHSCNNITDEDLELFLSQRLIETGEKLYPYFIPRMKSVGIFDIQGDL